jgi:pyrimidine deaminase RibD-like protein
MDDEHFIRMAIDAARKCEPEDGRTHPKVGVVVVRAGGLVTVANRGELEAGEHAEYTALERKLLHDTLVGATVYTTLEPCTSRSHPKVPCVERLIERKVGRVCIGMLDPNPAISGKGQQRLRDANITTDLFPERLMAEVEELNREFVRQHRHVAARSNDDAISARRASSEQRTVRLDRASGLLRLQVPVGDYVEIHHHGRVVRVSIEEIVEREFPCSAIHSPRHGRGCHMKVSSGGGLLFCGKDCESVGTNEFVVPEKEFDLEEPVSVYFFWTTAGSHRFFRLFVEHINGKTGVVTLNAFLCHVDTADEHDAV